MLKQPVNGALRSLWSIPRVFLCATVLLTTRVHGSNTRLVSVPDLHGDYKRAVKILSAAQLIDPKTLLWVGGNATLVQTGDIVDRGDDAKQIYELFFRLAKEALNAGGSVINVLGNHELMNIQQDLRYVSAGDFAAFGGRKARAEAWAPDGWLGKQVRRFPVTAKVDNVLFVHAGLSPEFLKDGRGLKGVNEDMALALKFNAPKNTAQSMLLKSKGPVWTREFSMPHNTVAMCKKLDKVLELTGTKRMVVGHTIQDSLRASLVCGGRLILADTAISSAYGGEMSFIEHNTDGSAIAIYPGIGVKHELPISSNTFESTEM